MRRRIELDFLAAEEAYRNEFNRFLWANANRFHSDKSAAALIAYRLGLIVASVKAVLTNYLLLAAKELKTHGNFKYGGCLNMKLKRKTPPLISITASKKFTRMVNRRN